ncbi:hypothetical protein ACE2AJ_19485 [Aquihabitans daechungensis]|uniref:hypothetical protein n=1 Tax=Aquihabitans daechungensis TaxID=1052257 RepID=UPI003B9FD25E
MTTDPSTWTRRRFLGATVTASGLAVAGLAGCSLGRASSPDPAEEAATARTGAARSMCRGWSSPT